MPAIEEQIKDFVRKQGVEVVGVAGPERLDGPPSMDPTYTMRGAKSIVCFAIPFDVGAINEFLGKKSPTPHNLDQLKLNQRAHRISRNTSDFIKTLGYRAEPVPSNNTYRRSPDVFSTHPSFSHRFGAIASGIGAHGWSGNVMTRKYGAAVVLGTLVTDAVLKSDPEMEPRFFMDEMCSKCKLCEKVCVAGMFSSEQEECVLINGKMHPRGKRLNVDFCNASCFGLHGVSRDKKWTTWGRYWIREWTERMPDASEKSYVRRTFLRRGGTVGDSTKRYDLIRRIGSLLWPEEFEKGIPEIPDLPADAEERNKILVDRAKYIGIDGLRDYNVLTCGQCMLVCGPTLKDTAERYNNLIESGLVVPGEGGKMVNVETYEEAVKIREKYPLRVPRNQMIKDMMASVWLWHKFYFGIEPRSIYQNIVYQRKLKKALRQNQG